MNVYSLLGNNRINWIDLLGLDVYRDDFIRPLQPGDFVLAPINELIVNPSGKLRPYEPGITDQSMDYWDLYTFARGIPRSLKDLATPVVCAAKRKLRERLTDEIKGGPNGAKKHTPGQDHDSKSKVQKDKRFQKKAADACEEADQRLKQMWDTWNILTPEQQKLTPELDRRSFKR